MLLHCHPWLRLQTLKRHRWSLPSYTLTPKTAFPLVSLHIESNYCMAKPTAIFEVISLQLIKINEKKTKKNLTHFENESHPLPPSKITYVTLMLEKVSDAGKDWQQKEKTAAEDETIGWRHRFNGHELGQTPRNGEGQGGLACCGPRVSMGRTRLGNWTTLCLKTFTGSLKPIWLNLNSLCPVFSPCLFFLSLITFSLFCYFLLSP